MCRIEFGSALVLRFEMDMADKTHPNQARTQRGKRPMAVARRVNLVGREITERLSSAGVEMLLGRAARLSEGQVLAGNRYYGSTMLTLDLQELHDVVRDSCDAATAARLARLLEGNPAVTREVRAIARQEACRIAGRQLTPNGVDMRVRSEGSCLFIDVDVEAAMMHKTERATA